MCVCFYSGNILFCILLFSIQIAKRTSQCQCEASSVIEVINLKIFKSNLGSH